MGDDWVSVDLWALFESLLGSFFFFTVFLALFVVALRPLRLFLRVLPFASGRVSFSSGRFSFFVFCPFFLRPRDVSLHALQLLILLCYGVVLDRAICYNR